MSKQFLSATAFALLIGVSTFSLNAALAQNGGEARSNDREIKKTLDDKHLTPVRPIRRVGEDSWPAAKDQPAPSRDTTGQSAKKDENEQPAKQETQNTQNTSKPDAKQSKDHNLGNQSPPPDKQDAKKDAAKPERKQDTAKQDAPKPDSKPDSKPDAKPDAKPQDTAKQDTKQDTKSPDQDKKGFASIRLGTDESGRVAVNEAQEKQIARAVRKQHVDTVNVKVNVGSVAPANVRLVTVSSDLVDILPQFRDYNYFVTREEIVIVAPSTRKVVALIPAKLTATAARPNEEERTTRTETRQPEPKPKTAVRERDVTVGRSARNDGVPSREEILAAPAVRGPAGTTVTRTYRSYQYDDEPDDDVVVIQRRRPRFFGFW